MADSATQSHVTFVIIDETACLVSWWMLGDYTGSERNHVNTVGL